MKIYVMVDMEGVSGIFRSSQVSRESGEYQEGRKFLTADVNACIEGCFAGGAKKVTVRDCHGGGFNFLFEDLDPRADYVQGSSPDDRLPGLTGADGLMLLGYHGMAGTRAAVLEHTMSSAGWQHFFINGRESGEIAIDAGLAGERGVPTILVSGDDKVCAETKKFLKGTVTVEVKKGLDTEGALLLPLSKAQALIRAGAQKAVALCKSVKPYRIKSPVTLRLELVSRKRVPDPRPGLKILDARTYEVKGKTLAEAMALL